MLGEYLDHVVDRGTSEDAQCEPSLRVREEGDHVVVERGSEPLSNLLHHRVISHTHTLGGRDRAIGRIV